MVEKKEGHTLNEAIESIFLQERLEDLIKNRYVEGFSKEVEENIDSEEYRKELENDYQTHILILERKQPTDIDFEDNQ